MITIADLKRQILEIEIQVLESGFDPEEIDLRTFCTDHIGKVDIEFISDDRYGTYVSLFVDSNKWTD